MTGDARCPYCLAALRPVAGEEADEAAGEEDEVVACARCGTAHHQACFREHGRCTLLGCGAAEARADAAPAPRPGSLSPLLPVGRQRIDRPAAFLGVRPEGRDRRDRPRRGALELDLPPWVGAAGADRLEGRVAARVPRGVMGEGLRVVVESRLHTADRTRLLSREEAVLAGRPRESWLRRLRPGQREPAVVLLGVGRSTFAVSLASGRLRWRGPLPAGAADGAVQTLRLRAVCAAPSVRVRSAAATVRLLDGRPLPPALGPDARLDPEALAAPAPLPRPAGAWLAQPVRGGPEDEVAAAWAVAPEPPAAAAVPADAVELTVDPLAARGAPITGRVEVARRRPLVGRVVVEAVVERRRPRDRAWRPFARERLVVADGAAEDAEPGAQTLRFEYVPPPSFGGGRPNERSRLRLEAVVAGEGRPLRSTACEVALGPRKRKGTRRRARG